MITIMVPTYNRAEYLKDVYEKLKKQTDKDFEWIIVNDGSTDNTEEVAKEMIDEKIINIRYLYQENQGKNTAHNNGVKIAKGEYFMCMDDDDFLIDTAVEILKKDIQRINESEDIIGLVYLNYEKGTNKIIGSELPDGVEASYFDLYHKYKITGDKHWIFKTNLLRENLVEVQEGEKFIPEALLFNRVSKKYKFLCINKPIACKEYLIGGFTDKYFQLVKKNPKGNVLYYKELYEFEPTLYNIAAYDMFSMFAKIKMRDAIKNHPAPFKAFIMYLPAYFKYKQKGGNK